MSNPGVIVLSSLNDKKGYFKRFQVEDNIGECIHVHIDLFRFDLTIEEFYEMCDIVRSALDNLDIFPGYSINNFDERYLSRVLLRKGGGSIPVKIKKVPLPDLRFIVRKKIMNLYYFSIVKIEKTPHFKYFEGFKDDYLNYAQCNYSNLENSERIERVSSFMKENGYPYKDMYISMYSGQNIVRDGLHRAAYLASTHGVNSSIDLLELGVADEKFNTIKATLGFNMSNIICMSKRVIKTFIIKYNYNAKNKTS